MKFQFYVFITTVMLTFEYGKGLEGLQKQVNGLKQTNNNKSLLMIVINTDERNKPIFRTNSKKKDTTKKEILSKKELLKQEMISRKEKMQQMKLQKEHELRMKEIIDFMKTHIYSTDYLLKEVQRIKRDRTIKDELREMVSYLEKPDKYKEKRLVLNYFYENKRAVKHEKIYGLWNQKPNDAVINVFKDPFNDGVLN